MRAWWASCFIRMDDLPRYLCYPAEVELTILAASNYFPTPLDLC